MAGRSILSRFRQRFASPFCARRTDFAKIRNKNSFRSFSEWRNSPIRVTKHDEGDTNRTRVLIIYTGGTIGMSSTPYGLKPIDGYLEQKVSEMDELNAYSNMPLIDILRWDELLDSSNMDPGSWALLAKQIHKYYFDYDGFVVLHGTDTMSYTASALSFMLENLGKPVILTGSQVPFSQVYNDARRNLVVSTIFASMSEIPEVCVFFDTQLMRGNRSSKIDSVGFNAFTSPNFPPLATLSSSITIREDLLLPQPRKSLKVHHNVKSSIAVLHLVPGFHDGFLHQLSEVEKGTLAGVILHLYGTGNAPSKKESFLKAIQRIHDQGIIVMAVSQCLRGSVNMEAYEVGRRLKDVGVLNGGDLTLEAASTKLGYLLSRNLSEDVFESAMLGSIRGERTEGVESRRIINEGPPFLRRVDSAAGDKTGVPYII